MNKHNRTLKKYQRHYQAYLAEATIEYLKLGEEHFSYLELLRTATEAQRTVLYMTCKELEEKR